MPETSYKVLWWSVKEYWMHILFVLFPVATTLYVMAIANPFTLLRPGTVADVDVLRAILWTMISMNVSLIFILVEVTTLYLMWFSQQRSKK
jgi:heme/copper-type cytochrome/quinol oxidase subunit 2